MFASWHGRFSPVRRRLITRMGAAGISFLVPGCGPAEKTPAPSQAAGGDFAEGALRLDLRQRRIRDADDFTLEALRFERQWPGRREKLAEGPEWGDYRLSVYSPEREAPLFRQGFDTGVDPGARAATARVSVRLPMPRRPVRAAIEKRRGERDFQEVAGIAVDPGSGEIDRSPPAIRTRVDGILASGAPAAKVDIAILGDGYRDAEHSKFAADAARAADYLFSVEPFAKRKGDFNVYSVFAASAESGVTDPYLGLRKNTVFGSAYGSGGAERTLAGGNITTVREAASAVPYDFLLILANARRFGGSAWFGGPAVAAIDSAAAKYLVVHEFAHVIGGLADEYYFPEAGGPSWSAGVEPWYPNVTASSDGAKWRERLSTPAAGPGRWNKAEYERYFAAYLKRYEALRSAGAPEAEVEKLLEAESRRQSALLAKNAGGRQAGVYEGAGGYAKGMYRSGADCIMFSLQAERFCVACSAAIERMIDFHSRD